MVGPGKFLSLKAYHSALAFSFKLCGSQARVRLPRVDPSNAAIESHVFHFVSLIFFKHLFFFFNLKKYFKSYILIYLFYFRPNHSLYIFFLALGFLFIYFIII